VLFSTQKTDEAKALFSKGFILKAAAAYDQALKLVSPDDPRAGEMHRERAACFMYAKQYADVVVEATRALKTTPNDPTALFYRAKAYELLGQGKKAKADAATAAAIVTDDENEKRAIEAAKAMLAPEAKPAGGPAGLGGLGLAPKKDAKSGKEAPLTAAQLAERQAAQARQAEALRQRQNQAKWGPPVAVKATCGDDARVVIVPSMISHKDLMTTLQRKFPDQSAFTVRFTDADGASKPLNSRADFATAFLAAQAAKEATKEGEEAKPTLHNLPVLKLSIVEHSSATTTEADAGEPATDAAAPLAPNEVVEIDEWILDFAALFREHLGIDAEAHLDLHAEVRARSFPYSRTSLSRRTKTKTKKRRRKRGGDDEKPHDYPERTLTNVLQMSFAPIASRLGDDLFFSPRRAKRNETFFRPSSDHLRTTRGLHD
jgi:tetratricopeptide (TPR) repeat protein